MFPIADIDDVTLAFPAGIKHLMPPYADIPEEFKQHLDTKWNRLQSDWFYRGITKLEVTPKPGVNKDKALRHLAAIQGSYEPKHEHKEAAVAFLMSEWFEDATWEPCGKGGTDGR